MLALWGLLAWPASSGAQTPAQPDEGLRLLAPSGALTEPLGSGDDVRVFVFVRRDCPVSGRYAPELARLQQAFPATGAHPVRLVLVYVDPADTPALVEAHQREYAISLDWLLDPHGPIGAADRGDGHAGSRGIRARVAWCQGLLDRGRIDDRFVDVGRTRPAPTRHELRDAIEAALEGRASGAARRAGDRLLYRRRAVRPMRVSSWKAAVALAAMASAAAWAATPRAPAADAAVTWARDVAPILHAECAPCHHPGGAGPFSLLSYDEARKRARQIAQVTGRRYMPPWLPDRHGPRFEDTRALTDAQIATLAAWTAQGAPAGDPGSAPALPGFPDGWQLGTPDLVLHAEAAWTLPAEGPDVYRNVVFRVPLAARRFVRGIEVQPGNRRVTHHANVYVDHSGWGRARDAEDPEPGFPGMDLQIASNRFDPESHFLFYKPGTPAVAEPADMAWVLEPGDDLILNLHLRPTGKPEPIAPSLGLYFTERAPSRFPMLLQLENDTALDIPAGASAFSVSDALTLPVAVQLAAVYPHAHALGHVFEAWATPPGGRRIPLIRVPQWDPAWQGVFRYASPLALPAGTRVEMRWEYDNSERNERNPSDPPVRVRAGNQSTDEMAHFWIQVIPPSRDDRLPLQEAVMRHRLERVPNDFAANANLAAVLQTRGRLDEAIAVYRRAVAARPDVASIRNALGTALQATGAYDEAIAEFAAAVRLDGASPDPWANWGNALLALQRPAEALARFEQALQFVPTDAGVLNDCGTAYAMLGRWPQARARYERALEADPAHGDAHYNLARVLVQMGDLAASLPHYEAAVKLQKDNHDAVEELAAVRAALRGR